MDMWLPSSDAPVGEASPSSSPSSRKPRRRLGPHLLQGLGGVWPPLTIHRRGCPFKMELFQSCVVGRTEASSHASVARPTPPYLHLGKSSFYSSSDTIYATRDFTRPTSCSSLAGTQEIIPHPSARMQAGYSRDSIRACRANGPPPTDTTKIQADLDDPRTGLGTCLRQARVLHDFPKSLLKGGIC